MKTTRRQFLLTATAAAVGALTAGIVKAEKPVPVEDIQAVPLDAAFGGYLVSPDNVDDMSCECPDCQAAKQQMIDWGFDV